MQITSFGNVHDGQKQQDGHAGGHYTHHEGEGQQHANLDSVKKVVHWNYKGHGHSVDSGGKLGATHGEVLSGSQDGHGHMTHSTDHTLSMADGGVNGDVHTHILSGHHNGGVENDYNHLEYAQGQVPCADFGGVVGSDHSEMNAGHYHVLSGDCKGDIRSGHTQVGHGFGQALSGNYGGELGGDHSHKDYELSNVLSGDYEKVTGGGQSHMDNGHAHNLSGAYGAGLEGGHGSGNILTGNYGTNIGGGQNHIDTVNDHVLTGDHGGKAGSVQSYGHVHVSSADYGGNLGGGHNLIRHANAYDSTGGLEGGIMVADGHMGYGHKSNGYKVHENVRENQPSELQNYGINDNRSMNLRYVEYTHPKTATDLGDQSVGLNGSHEFDATKYQRLHIDGSVIGNGYGDAVRDAWYKSHNSMEKDHASFEHSFGNNHVD
jgi:hypothetical protein